MCQFPGCEAEHRLHSHHVIHWVNGGETELHNLISLCHFHHHSVHEGGWTIVATSDGFLFMDTYGKPHRVSVLRLPTNRVLPPAPTGSAEPLAASGERCDPGYIADILVSNTTLRKARATT